MFIKMNDHLNLFLFFFWRLQASVGGAALTQLMRQLVAENGHRRAETAGQTLSEGSACKTKHNSQKLLA